MVTLPWVDLCRPEFLTRELDSDGDLTWTPQAEAWGNKYVKTLKSLDTAIRNHSKSTPIPHWATDEKFKTYKETKLSGELLQIQKRIAACEMQRENIQELLAKEGGLKRLLFEQGQELEKAILDAMRLMGFSATSYRDSDSEFDAVLECPEGRCIGEAEGRDNKPINIEKMRQLEVNILEDLNRDGVEQPAKGILFGNAYRLTPPSERMSEHFTTKCVTAAQRNETALIRTCDLFDVAQALADHPDADLAASCRRAIFGTAGEIVKSPAVPSTQLEKQKTKVKKKIPK